MSHVIDERILQMKFDNEQFEEGARQSIETLDELDKALQLEASGEGLTKIQNESGKLAGGMHKVASAVGVVAKKFSTLEIMGMGSLSSIGASITNNITRTLKSLTGWNDFTSGWQKYGSEVEAVQTILNATGESMETVQGELDKLAWFTDETSYSYDAMVANIGKFNTAGVDLKTSVRAMMGIADTAGYFGVNANKATHAMEGFAKAMGAQTMNAQNWKWIQTAGMDTQGLRKEFIKTAIELGKLQDLGNGTYKTLKKGTFTANDFTSKLKDNWLDQEVMLKTFSKYSKATEAIYAEYDKLNGSVPTSELIDRMGKSLDQLSLKAFKSAQEAKTFKEAIDSVHEAISSQWRSIFTSIFGNYEEARALWSYVANEMWTVFATAGDIRKEMFRLWHDDGGREYFIKGLKNIWETVKVIIEPISKAFNTVFYGVADAYDRAEPAAKKMVEWCKKFYDWTRELAASFGIVTNAVEETKEEVEEILGPVAKTKKILDQLAQQTMRGDYGNGEARVKKLRELGYSYELVQNRVNELMNCSFRYEVQEDKVTKKKVKKKKLTEEEAALEKKLAEEREKAAKRLQNISDIFTGLFSAMKLGKEAIKGLTKYLVTFVLRMVKTALPGIDKIIDKLAEVGRFFTSWAQGNIPKGFTKGWEIAKQVLDKVAESFGHVFNVLVDHFGIAWEWAKKFFVGAWEEAKKFYEVVSNGEGIKKLGAFLQDLWENLKVFGKNAFGTASDFFSKLFGDESGEKKSVGQWLGELVDWAAGKLSEFGDFVNKAREKIEKFFSVFSSKDADKMGVQLASVENITGDIEKTSGVFEKLTPKFDDFLKLMNDMKTDAETFFHVVSNPLDGVLKAFEKVFNKISELFDNLTLEGLGEAFKNTGIGVFFGMLAKNLADGTSSLSAIPSNINVLLVTVKDTLVAYQKELKSSYLLDIAKAIGILTLSIIGLSGIDQQVLTDVTGNLVLVLMALSAVFKGYAAIKKNTQSIANYDFKGDFTAISRNLVAPLTTFMKTLGDAIAKKINAGNTSKGLLRLVVAIGLFIGIIYLIKEYFPEDPKEIEKIQLAAGIAAAIGAFLVVLTGLSRFKTSNATTGWALGFITMALGILILMTAIEKLSKWPVEQLQKAIGAILMISILILAIGGAMKLMETTTSSKFAETSGGSKSKTKSKTGANVLGFIFMMIAIAAAIAMLQPVFESISKMSDAGFAKVIAVLMGVAVLMTIFTGIANVLGDSKGMAKQINDGIKTVIKIILAIALMNAVMSISGSNSDSIGKGLLITAGALIVLAGAMLILNAMGGGEIFEKVAYGMFQFGLGLLALNAGLLVGALAFKEFGKAMPFIISGLMLLGTTVKEHIVEMGLALLVVVGVIIALAFASKYISKAADAFISFGKNAGKALISFVESLPKIFEKIKSVGPLLIVLAGGLLLQLVGFLDKMIPSLVETLLMLLLKLIDSLAVSIGNHGGDIMRVLLNVVKGIVGAIVNALGEMLAMLAEDKGWIGDITRFLFGSPETIRKNQWKMTSSFTKSNQDITGTLKKGLDEYQKEVNTGAQKTEQSINNGGEKVSKAWNSWSLDPSTLMGDMSGLGDAFSQDEIQNLLNGGTISMDYYNQLSPDVQQYFTAFNGEVSDGIDEVEQTATTESATMFDGLQENVAYLRVGEALEQSDLAGLPAELRKIMIETNTVPYEYLPELSEATREKFALTKEEAVHEIDDLPYLAGAAVKPTASQVSRGMRYDAKLVEDAGNTLKNKALTGMDPGNGSYNIGKQYSIGMAAGIASDAAKAAVANAAREIVRVAEGASRSEGVIKSPSRLMMVVGDYMTQGFALGMTQDLGIVENSSKSVVDSAMDEIRNAIASANDMFAQDFDMNPVISPVMDLSNVRNGVGMLRGMVNNRSFALAAGLGGGVYSKYDAYRDNINSVLNDKFGGLDSRMASIEANSSYEFTSVVDLDGREVARGTAVYTSEELNRIARNNNRKAGKRG